MDSVKESFGEFIGGLLSSMAYSAYVPAAVVAGWVWLMTRIAETGSTTAALGSLSETSIGSAAVFIIVVFVVTALINPFQFAAIQLLEGYGNSTLRRPGYLLEGWRFDRLERRLERLALKEELLRHRVAVADNAGKNPLDPEEAAALSTIGEWKGWRAAINAAKADPAWAAGMSQTSAVVLMRWAARSGDNDDQIKARHRLGRAVRKSTHAQHMRDNLPLDRSELLPTKLGNRMRVHETAATEAASVQIDELVPQAHDGLPPELRRWHDRAKSQLEMHCTLALSLVACATGSVVLLDSSNDRIVYGVAALALARCAYGGALLAADEYGVTLSVIGKRSSETGSGDPSAQIHAGTPQPAIQGAH